MDDFDFDFSDLFDIPSDVMDSYNESRDTEDYNSYGD